MLIERFKKRERIPKDVDWLRKTVALLYPERCPYCGRLIEADGIACEECLAEIVEKEAAIFRGAGGCRCVSPFRYDGRVRKAILNFKHHDHPQYARPLAKAMLPAVRERYAAFSFDLISYVPMHVRDERKRGYNQTELVAKELSKALDIPVAATLKKVKRTKMQHGLTRSERLTNLRNAFRVIEPEQIAGKRILMIDDIVTTGSTLAECARTLNKAKPALLCFATIANANLDEKIPKPL